jgi:hypothetical protein
MGDEGSKAEAYKVFEPKLVEEMKQAVGTYRGIFEPSTPTTQCEKSGHPFITGMPCYICGFAIPDTKTLAGASDELYPECEHLFPVTQARWFLDLYMSTRPPTDQWTETAVKLEYDYAHRVCNQAKGMKSFVMDTEGVPSYSQRNTLSILKHIQDRAKANLAKGYADKTGTMAKIRDTILTRAPQIKARIETLVAHVKEQTVVTDPALKSMVLLARATLFADPGALAPRLREIHDRWYATKSATTDARKAQLATFASAMYARYPFLSPANLNRTLAEKLAAAGDVTPYIPAGLSEALTETLFAAGIDLNKPDDGPQFVATFLYGAYQALYSALKRDTKTAATTLSLRCTLVDWMSTILVLDKKRGNQSSSVFGALPSIPDGDVAACTQLKQKVARALRTEDESDTLHPSPTLEEDVIFVMEGFGPSITAAFGPEYDSRTLIADATKAVRKHLMYNPGDVDGARAIGIRIMHEYLPLFDSEKAVRAERMFLEWAGQSPRGGRRRKTYRKTSKRRKTLRKRVRAGVVPK